MAEKEYIERKAAYEKCGWYNTVNGKSVCAVRKDELAAIPAADVVPVVRCKDCKTYKTDYMCFLRKPDDFCSYGERKEVL